MQPRLTRGEMIELATKVRTGQGDEGQMGQWIDTLRANLAHPRVVWLLKTSATAEEAIDTALACKAQPLPPPVEPG